MRLLHNAGWGAKRIAAEVGVAHNPRNTVRRYLRSPLAEVQVRPSRRSLDDDARSRARELYAGPAAGNAVVVQRMLGEHGLEASVRTVQRARPSRRNVASNASPRSRRSVRDRAEPRAQMQIDFGEKWVSIAGELVRVFLLVARLGYSRRPFAMAFLNQRSDDGREGIAAAFRHFGGVTRTMLVDDAKALVLGRERATGVVTFHPVSLAFCRDGRAPSRNCLAGRELGSLAELESHVAAWLIVADERVRGTTHIAAHRPLRARRASRYRPASGSLW